MLSETAGIQNQYRTRGQCRPDRILLQQHYPKRCRRTANAGELHAQGGHSGRIRHDGGDDPLHHKPDNDICHFFCSFLLNKDFVYQQLSAAIWFVYIGWIINFAAVPLVLLAAFKRQWVQKLAEFLIGLLEKIHLIRNREMSISKVTEVLDTYHTALLNLMHSPGQILLQFACSTVSLFGLFGTIVFVYYAFGQSGTPWYHILTLSSLLFISASYTPLPGASGAQEGGFLLYFQGIFKDGTIGLALLIWRFFTFYLYLIVGVFTILLEKIILRREAKKRKRDTDNSGQ